MFIKFRWCCFLFWLCIGFSSIAASDPNKTSIIDISVQYDQDLKLDKNIFFDDGSMNIIFNDHDVEQDVWFLGIGTEFSFIDVSTMNPKIKYGFSNTPSQDVFQACGVNLGGDRVTGTANYALDYMLIFEWGFTWKMKADSEWSFNVTPSWIYSYSDLKFNLSYRNNSYQFDTTIKGEGYGYTIGTSYQMSRYTKASLSFLFYNLKSVSVKASPSHPNIDRYITKPIEQNTMKYSGIVFGFTVAIK